MTDVRQCPAPSEAVVLYKAVYEEFADNPFPSRSAKGRFHDAETAGSTTYLAAYPTTSWKEVVHRWKANPAVYRMASVRVSVSNIVDLTSAESQRRYKITEPMLTGDEYGPTQLLAHRLRSLGVEAVWTYSRADQPNGRVLVVFLEQRAAGSEVTVDRVAEIEDRHIEG